MYEHLVDTFISAISRGDASGVAALYTEDAVCRHPLEPEQIEGRQAIQEMEQALFDAFSNISIDVKSVTADPARVVLEVELHATNTGDIELGPGQVVEATGRGVSIPAVWVLEVGSEGLITSERDYFDTAALMDQLGLAEGEPTAATTT